jgi:hypothetical protein
MALRIPGRPDFWMGDSRGRWEGDTLVVDVANNNDKTWFDMAGDFHSDALHVVERYRMTAADTIQYEATIEDSKVFTKPWTIRFALRRRTDRDRLFEYVCQAEVEEANGAFTREERTWYPGDGAKPAASCHRRTPSPQTPEAAANIRRTADGKPDLQGFTCPTPEARISDWRNTPATDSCRRAGRDCRSAGRNPSDAAVGRSQEKTDPETHRTRL